MYLFCDMPLKMTSLLIVERHDERYVIVFLPNHLSFFVSFALFILLKYHILILHMWHTWTLPCSRWGSTKDPLYLWHLNLASNFHSDMNLINSLGFYYVFIVEQISVQAVWATIVTDNKTDFIEPLVYNLGLMVSLH